MDDQFQKLFSDYLEGKCNRQQVEQLLKHFSIEENEGLLRDRIRQTLQEASVPDRERVTGLVERADQRIAESLRSPQAEARNDSRVFPWRWLIGTAAAVVLFAFIWTQWFQTPATRIVQDETNTYKNDVLPGESKAMLILSDGQTIQLDDDSASLQEVNGTRITGSANSLSYAPKSDDRSSSALRNTLVVPMAGTYQVELPDGTRVWLNALSKLSYPVQFSEGERRVQLQGEAYFDVQQDTSRPFIVEVGQASIQVFGTEFNIRAYEPVGSFQTTLVEGSVEVSAQGKNKRLVPGETAEVTQENIKVVPANMDEVIAWKEGYFYLNENSFTQIMDDISRWYGVELHYNGDTKVSRQHYSGSIDRTARLSQVLEMLKQVSDAEFEIDGDQLYISFK